MRTTINLPRQLMVELKRTALQSGTTMTNLIETAVREKLARQDRQETASEPVQLDTYGSGGVMPGIDLDDSASLLDAMESDADPDRR